jgi:hypothetical protein
MIAAMSARVTRASERHPTQSTKLRFDFIHQFRLNSFPRAVARAAGCAVVGSRRVR